MREESRYLVSAVVSVYNAEEFLEGCLEDLLAQTIADRIEIIVVDSASPQREGEIVARFRERRPDIRYVRTAGRESIYAAWNRGVRMATAPYVTNANADDRHRPDALERLVRALEEDPEAVLAYGGYFETGRKNDAWDSGSPRTEAVPPPFRRDYLLLSCYVGPQPLWRRSVHEEAGYFDARLRVAGDLDFWLRLAARHRFARVPEPLGLYYASPVAANAAARDLSRNRAETGAVQDRHFRRYLARVTPSISVVLSGDRTEAEWATLFREALSDFSAPCDFSVVSSAPADAVAGWVAAGGAEAELRILPAAGTAECSALPGDYVALVPPGEWCGLESVRRLADEAEERGYRAAIFESGGAVRCRIARADLAATFPGLVEALGPAGPGATLPGGVKALRVDRFDAYPFRGPLSRTLRLCELDAAEAAWFRRKPGRTAAGSLLRGAAGFLKAAFLKGIWFEGEAGRRAAILKGWSEYLKGVHGAGR